MPYRINREGLTCREALQGVDWTRVSDHICGEVLDATDQLLRLEGDAEFVDEEVVYHADVIEHLIEQLINHTLDRSEYQVKQLLESSEYLFHDMASAVVTSLHALANQDDDPVGFWWFGATLVRCKYEDLLSDFFLSAYNLIPEHAVPNENP